MRSFSKHGMRLRTPSKIFPKRSAVRNRPTTGWFMCIAKTNFRELTFSSPVVWNDLVNPFYAQHPYHHNSRYREEACQGRHRNQFAGSDCLQFIPCGLPVIKKIKEYPGSVINEMVEYWKPQ